MKNTKVKKKRYLEFVLLTEAEHAKLVAWLGPDLAGHWIEELDDYLGASEKNRRKYDSHYRAIRIWAKRDAKKKGGRGKNKTLSPADMLNLAAVQFIEDLKRCAYLPEMSPSDRSIVYAVLAGFKLPWPALRQRLMEDPTIGEEIKAAYIAEAGKTS